MFETVLVAVDGNETDRASIAAGAIIAEHAGARLRLVHVATIGQGDEAPAAVEAEVAASPVPAALEVKVGDPASVIVDEAAGSPAGLICLTSQGRGALGDLMAGSVTEAVLATSDAPTIVVGPEGSAGRLDSGTSVIICVDESSDCESIVGPATELIRALGVGATVVEVVPPDEQVHIDDVPRLDVSTASGRRRLEEVSTMLRIRGIDQVDAHVLYGADVAESVAHFAGEHDAAAVAMASHGLSGLRRLLRGSNTMRLIAMSPCPVLTVRCDAPR